MSPSSWVLCASVFGFAVPHLIDDSASELAQVRLSSKRRALVADYSFENSSDLVFERLEYVGLPV